MRYLDDSYEREFDATVTAVDGIAVTLDSTAFYPTGGGQPHDTGELRCGADVYKVTDVRKPGPVHVLDRQGLKVGDAVHGVLNWDRRYKLMRMHTAAHVLMQVLHNEFGALGTGNQLDVDKSRIDFSLESFDPAVLEKAVADANDVLQRDLPVTAVVLPREEALRIPGVSKLAMGLPAHIQDVRVLSIGDFDMQADGGTHVRSTKEVGRIVFLRAENKGAARRRAYFTVEP